jgi:aspartyl-tRNA(Asn)/glutamyl-tRNA(Gln) amidotransferase subunit B
LPVVTGGSVAIQVDGVDKVITLTRAHLEEDAGKSFHEGLDTPGVSGIDLNRAGTPLLEVVTEPDMRSAAEAVAYAKALHGIVTWVGICDGNMQEGSFRCDANVSVRRVGEPLGTRCEIKNLNSFRFMERAINYEVRRQIELIEDGGKVIQQTRLYDADRDETRAMRSKEDAMDYRYFPCPDLLPLAITEDDIANVAAKMIASPQSTQARFQTSYALSEYDARLLTASRPMARYFEDLMATGCDAKLAANWINGELAATLNRHDMDIAQSPISAGSFGQLLKRISDGSLSSKLAKDVLGFMWAGEHQGQPDAIIAARGLMQMSDVSEIEEIVDTVIANNEKSVAEFKAGKERALQSLVGQVMKASSGKANPAQVNTILRDKLSA